MPVKVGQGEHPVQGKFIFQFIAVVIYIKISFFFTNLSLLM